MLSIPVHVRENPLSQRLAAAGLTRIHQGKVRDTWLLPSGLLLVVVTDRLSIYDIVMPNAIDKKGEVLNDMSILWFRQVLTGWPNHLVAAGADIDPYVDKPSLRHLPELQKTATVVRKLPMVPIECIVRRYLTGSGWIEYQSSGRVCGIELPKGLRDGSRLPEDIFTPSSKATEGHDVNLDAEQVVAKYGQWIRECSLLTFKRAADYAESRGILLADTKLEFGFEDGQPILADEVFTPDSSRFWDVTEWNVAAEQSRTPPSHDKQLVRDWGKTLATPFKNGSGEPLTLNKLDNTNADHMRWVAECVSVPAQLRDKVSKIYQEIFERLVGVPLDRYQRSSMRIGA